MATDLMGLTEYQKLLEVVGQYYGVGSDQWLTIASQSNIQSTEWAQILSQTPNVNVTLNNAGEVMSYTVSDAWGTATENAASAVINSNTQAATMANPSTVNIPANTSVTQAGTVAAESGMKTTASGATVSTVVKNVALGVGAVAVGVRSGVKLSNLIYTHGSYIWDEETMQAFNPQTWDSICTTQNGKNIFNMVFGIDKNTGTTQAYIDERAFAYVTAYLDSLGAYSTGSIETPSEYIPRSSAWDLSSPTLAYIELPFDVNTGVTYTQYANGSPAIDHYVTQNQSTVYSVLATNQDGVSDPSSRVIFVSDAPFKYTRKFYSGGNIQSYDATPYTIGTETYYAFSTGASNLSNWTPATLDPPFISIELDGIKLIYNSDLIIITPYEGITPQTGATLPTEIPSGGDITAVLNYLRTLYPDMFDDAIYNDVLQPDGTTTRYIYVPVGFPDTFTLDETTGEIQPTGGETTTQADPTIDPTTATDSLIDTLLKILESTDPYSPTKTPDDVTTDYPETGGGTTPPFVIPTGSASALYSVYNPSQAELNSLGAWLWSSNFVDQLLKLFNDPMQAIIGLHKVFVSPPISGTGTIKVGYLDSGVGSNLVSAQYTEIDCGTVQLKEYFGNALDYIKTDIYLYLPFVGIVPLNVEDVTRANINVKYKVDVLTGACLASVNVTRDLNAGGQLYVYAGNCAVQYPLSSGSYMGIVASALGIAGSIAGTVLSGGAMLPVALGVGASALGGARTKVEHSGSLSGNSGAMGIKKPYLIIRRPQTKIANNFEILAGVSQNEYGVLSSYTGQTRVKYVHLENIPATDNELTQIEELLKSGVLI